MEFINSCRLCRQIKYTSSFSINSSRDGIEISEILAQTIPINFNDEISSILPQKVCHKCYEISKSAYELQKTAIDSDKFFRSSIVPQLCSIEIKCEKQEVQVKTEIECEDYEVHTNQLQNDESDSSSQDKPVRNRRGGGRKRKDPEAKVNEPFNPRPAPQNSKSLYSSWYECNFCDKILKPKKNMERHMRLHDPKIHQHGCKKCTKRFGDKIALQLHVYDKHKLNDDTETIYECDKCGATGNRRTGMKNHIIDDHLRVETTKIIEESPQTKRKRSKVTAEIFVGPQKCEKCDEIFIDKNNLDFHVFGVHEQIYRQLNSNEIEINLKCCKCDEEAENVERLMMHLTTHKEGFKKFKCQLCKEQIKDFNDFIEHSKYHLKPPTHKCLVHRCKKDFQYDEKFLNHLRAHAQYDSNKAECEKCGLRLRSKKDLEVHDRVRHQQETLFICPICAKSMSSKNALDQHLRLVHNKEEEKKFQCRFCSMKLISKASLTRHEATHSTERPHVCEICAMTFKQNYALKVHVQRHNGTLPKNHVCSQCGHGFFTKHRLEQHMLTHTGLKPHECKFCDRAYASKGDLTKHMQKLHVGDSIYQCEKCPRGFRLLVELREHLSEHSV